MSSHSSARAEELAHLLGNTGWLRELARSLVGDPFDAEDLMQEALALAKEEGRWTTGRLGAWIAGILRNRAKQHYRSESRRLAREQKAAFARAQELHYAEASGEHPDPAFLAQRVEQQRLLAETLLLLEAQSREVLLLFYYGDRSLQQISVQLGLSVKGVETRLRRAKVRLRESLEKRVGRGQWAIALVPLLPKGMAAPLPGPPAFSLTGFLTAAAVLLLACAIWIPQFGNEPDSLAQTVASTPPAGPQAPAIADGQFPQRQDQNSPASTSATIGNAWLHLMERGTGFPMVDLKPAMLFLRPATAVEKRQADHPAYVLFKKQVYWELGESAAVTDDAGLLAMNLPEECETVLLDLNLHTATHSMARYSRGYRMFLRDELTSGKATIEMVPRSGQAVGRVVTPAGEAIPNAEIDLVPTALFHDDLATAVTVRADSQGLFRLDHVACDQGGFELRPRLEGYLPLRKLAVMRYDGPDQLYDDIELMLGPISPVHVGVQDGVGNPVAGATVIVTSRNREQDFPAYLRGQYAAAWEESAATGPTGEVALGAPDGIAVLWQVSAPGFNPWQQEMSARPGLLPVTLEQAASLKVRVLSDGAPVPEALLRLVDATSSHEEQLPTAVTDENGDALFVDIPSASTVWVVASEPSMRSAVSLPQIMAGGEQQLTMELLPGMTLGGRLEDWRALRPSADPPRVYLEPVAASPWLAGAPLSPEKVRRQPLLLAGGDKVQAGADGSFLFHGLAPGHYRVWFGKREVPLGVVEAEAGQQDVVLRPGDGAAERPVVAGQVRDSMTGAPIRAYYLISRRYDEQDRELNAGPWQLHPPTETVRAEDGRYHMMLPQSGSYTIAVWVPLGYVTLERPAQSFVPGESALDFDLSRAKPLRLQINNAQGKALAGVHVSAFLEDGTRLLQPGASILSFHRELLSRADGSLLLPAVPESQAYQLVLQIGRRTMHWDSRDFPSADGNGVIRMDLNASMR